MSALHFRFATVASTVLLSACIAGDGAGPSGIALGPSSFAPMGPVSLGPSTGTAVGRRVGELQHELSELKESIGDSGARLRQLRAEVVEDAQDYYGIVAAIDARLQVGTTPGNPVLVAQWGDAQIKLDEISADVARMNTLSGEVAADSTVAAYLLESVRATYGLAGALEEDHRQLAILEDEVNRTVVLIDRLLNELSQDVNRQTRYLANERSDLQALQVAITNGELYGGSLANRAFYSAAPLPVAGAGAVEAGLGPQADGRPLVVIRFDRPDVEYRQAVYQAVSQALKTRPNASFELIALSPAEGPPAMAARAANDARQSAEDVKRTLVTLGLPSDRIDLSSSRSKGVAGPEVHIHVR